MSLPLIAAIARSTVTVIPRHRLPPSLGKAFGGSTGLVDVGAGNHARDDAVHPHVDRTVADAGEGPPSQGHPPHQHEPPPLARRAGSAAPDRTSALAARGNPPPVPEVGDLPDLHPKAPNHPEPLLDPLANRRPPLE